MSQKKQQVQNEKPKDYKYKTLKWNEIDIMNIRLEPKIKRTGSNNMDFNASKILYDMDDDTYQLNMELPKVRGKGIFRKDNYVPSICVEFDPNNQEHVDFLDFYNSLHKRIIVQYYKVCEPDILEAKYLKMSDEDMQNEELHKLYMNKIKSHIAVPKKGRENQPATMYMKLNNTDYNDTFATKFRGIKGEFIDCLLLEKCEFDFIPLWKLERVYIGSTLVSFQARFTDAVVTMYYKKTKKEKQEDNIKSQSEYDEDYVKSKQDILSEIGSDLIESRSKNVKHEEEEEVVVKPESVPGKNRRFTKNNLG